MEKIELRGELRERGGKGIARSLRREGKIPAVLYGKGGATPIVLNPGEVKRLLSSRAVENTLITVQIAGQQGNRVALLRDFQVDPVSGALLHLDLFEVSMDRPIRLKVPVRVVGETPQGVRDGGMLQHHLREVVIECLPSVIPDFIPVDASHLPIGGTFFVGNLPVLEGIRYMDGPDQLIVSVAAPISEAKLEELLTAAKEVKEPELLKPAKGEEKEGAVPTETAKAEAKPAEKSQAPEKESRGAKESKEAKETKGAKEPKAKG